MQGGPRKRAHQPPRRTASGARHAVAGADGKERSMNLIVWLPPMFALGLVSMGLCLVFALACEQI
jgi:hypothetical protein